MITGIICARSLLSPNARTTIRKELATLGCNITLIPRKTSLSKDLGLHQLYTIGFNTQMGFPLKGASTTLFNSGFYTCAYVVQDLYLVSIPSVLSRSPTYGQVLHRYNFLILFTLLTAFSIVLKITLSSTLRKN